MTEKDSNDGSGEIDKLLAELENESLSEESNVIIEKQIQKNKDENGRKYDVYHDVGDKESKDDDDEKSEDYWS